MRPLLLLLCLSLAGCSYFLPTQESAAPPSCIGPVVTPSGLIYCQCETGAEIPEACGGGIAPVPPVAECITDSECAEAYPDTYGDPRPMTTTTNRKGGNAS